MRVQKILFYLTLITIIFASFFIYSSRFYPLLNSDDALNILMTYYYKLPQDFYCWGQDRGGTLIPLISQIPHKILGISPVFSVSISNYILLILGYVGFSSLFSNKLTKIFFALIWFFPPICFIELTRYPIGMQYSLIGFSIFLLNKLNLNDSRLYTTPLILLSITIIYIIAIWVSDLSIVSVLIIFIIIFYFSYSKTKQFRINKLIALYILIGSSIGFFFIKYAKSFATSIVTNYTKFNDRNSIKHGLEILKNILSDIFTFQTDENLLSFYAWLVLAILIIVIIAIFTKKLKIKFNNKQWLIVFVIDFVAILGIIILSKWVYVNGMGHWYFVPTYISLSLVILILFESVKTNTIQKKVLTILLGLAVFTGSLSTLHYLRYINPKTFKSQIDVKSEFLSLGEIGIIGNFWNSYIVACPNPSIIKATPHDAYVRNQNLVDEVFAQPKLYLIKNMWLNEFPDTINQFGYLLSKKGESFEIGGCKVNQYVRIQRNELIPLSDFSFYSSAIQNDSCILINKDSLLFNSKHHVWGPFIPVGIGKYTVKLQVEIEKAFMEESFALMDVVSNGGKTILASKELNFTNNKNIYELDFNCEKRYRNVEFRILSYGTLDFKILQVELIEK